MSALKNLVSLKRNVTRRIREALEELQENVGNLGNLERAPVPARIPVPVRGRAPFRGRHFNSRNIFGTLSVNPGLNGWRSSAFNRGFCAFLGFCGFQQLSSRFFTTYNKFGGFNSWRWARINQSVVFHNFSQRSQFRLKLFHRFYKTPTLTQLLKKKTASCDENTPSTTNVRTVVATPRRNVVPTSLRLSLLLTQDFHDLVLDLARPPSPETASPSVGCYVDFKIEPRILIPAATMMSSDVMRELITNLKRFEQHIAELQQDLTKLSELGELPIKFVSSENVIRVFFPNCDRAQLEGLLMEKNVLGGVIHEDFENDCERILDDDLVTSISEFDILSGCNSASLGLSGSANDDDILSLSDANSFNKIVHLEPVAVLGHVEIADDYFWA